jgi:hypothetical protein
MIPSHRFSAPLQGAGSRITVTGGYGPQRHRPFTPGYDSRHGFAVPYLTPTRQNPLAAFGKDEKMTDIGLKVRQFRWRFGADEAAPFKENAHTTMKLLLQQIEDVLSMQRIAFILLLLACAAGSSSFAQLARPNRVRLRVVVSYYGNISEKVRDATVELMDPVGGSSEMDKKLTDQSGQVEFNTSTGQHRIRITADGTYPYEGDFLISPVETFHMENFQLRRKEDAAGNAAPAGTDTVPVIRLKIPEKARKEFEKASSSMSEEDWSASRKYFQAAIDIYPKYDLAYNGLGIACLRMKDTQAAEQAFRKAIELNGKFAEAQRNLARIVLGTHNYQEAASLLNQSLESEPTNAWALTNAAYAELQLHRFKDAAAHALQVHALPHKDFANAHVIAAYALDAMGQKQEAIAQWELYLKEDPKGPNASRARDELVRLKKTM